MITLAVLSLAWTNTSNLLGATQAEPLVVVGPDTVLAGTDVGIFRTTDAGVTWIQVLASGAYVHDIYPLANGELLAGTWSSAVYRSTDRGTSWALVSNPPVSYTYAFAQAANGDVLAGTQPDAAIYRSTDNGTTWALVQNLYAGLNCNVHYLKRMSDNSIWAIGSDQATIAFVYRSTDNGATWLGTAALGGATEGWHVEEFPAGRIHATTGPARVYSTTDNGTTWQLDASLPETYTTWIMRTSYDVLYLGTAGGVARVYYSGDSGSSFPIYDNLTGDTQTWGLAEDSANSCVYAAASLAGDVFRACDALGGEESSPRRGVTAVVRGDVLLLSADVPQRVKVSFYDASGRLVAVPFDGTLSGGRAVPLAGARGALLVRVTSDERTVTLKAVVVR